MKFNVTPEHRSIVINLMYHVFNNSPRFKDIRDITRKILANSVQSREYLELRRHEAEFIMGVLRSAQKQFLRQTKPLDNKKDKFQEVIEALRSAMIYADESSSRKDK